MLNRFDNYDEVYNSFNWSIPDIYNIASDTIDKYSHTERIALKHISKQHICIGSLEFVNDSATNKACFPEHCDTQIL